MTNPRNEITIEFSRVVLDMEKVISDRHGLTPEEFASALRKGGVERLITTHIVTKYPTWNGFGPSQTVTFKLAYAIP
jgi:ribonuclease BN (tRNA processing enzyme)